MYQGVPISAGPRWDNLAAPAPAASTALTFDVVTPFQTSWLGVCADSMGFTEFPELGLTAAQKLAEYERMRVSGVRMVRTWFAPWWSDPLWPNGTRNWSSTEMGYFYTWLSNMQSRGIKVVLTMGWHFPNNVCGITQGGVIPTCTPTVPQETNWAAWCSEAFNEIINVRGYTNVVAGFFFTEPSTSTGDIPVGYTAQEYYAHLVTVARAKIALDDASRTPILPRVKLIGTEEQSFTDPSWLQYMVANANTQFDAYSAHSYVLSPTFAPLSLVGSQDPTFAQAVTRFTAWAGYAAPKAYWSDEWNDLAGGDADTFGYRQTADAGMRIGRELLIHMLSGAQASFIWTFHDEHFVDAAGYTQLFGMAKWIGTNNEVKPSWYAYSMLANLTGGTTGTKLYSCTGGTSTLHGVGCFVPYGDRFSTSQSGDWSFVLVNEGAAVNVQVLFPSLVGKTFYRYTYTGEIPPTAATNPAYLLPWDKRFPDTTHGLQPDVIPGHSVVVYSTMIQASPTSPNLALRATATASSTAAGSASTVINGNRTNVIGTANGWRKAADTSQTLTVQWTSPVTFSRLELAFAGTTAGVVWATYTDASSPSPLADYTVKYLNSASVWTDFSTPINVSSNTSPNKTHTFTAVTAPALQFTVTSAAATAWLNQLEVYAT